MPPMPRGLAVQLAAQQPVEWLADHGSCFAAHKTLAFARAVGLVPCRLVRADDLAR
jgi:hypothetical protein